jgi:hypothetical protein
MTTLYELSCGYTKLGVGTAPSSAPTITVVDSANNVLVAALTAVTALTNLVGAYRYSYSGADGLIVYGLFHTTDTSVDQQDLFVSALVGPSVRDIQTRIPAALVSGRMDASVGAMANDVITAAAHDESTAFPLKAADTGATILARAGDAMDLVASLKNKAGSSGYDRTTDSLEALGDSIGGNGGALSLVYTLTDSVTGLPVSGATIELYPTNTYTGIIDSQVTSALGVATFSYLTAGTYYLRIIKPGYATTTDSEVVA